VLPALTPIATALIPCPVNPYPPAEKPIAIPPDP